MLRRRLLLCECGCGTGIKLSRRLGSTSCPFGVAAPLGAGASTFPSSCIGIEFVPTSGVIPRLVRHRLCVGARLVDATAAAVDDTTLSPIVSSSSSPSRCLARPRSAGIELTRGLDCHVAAPLGADPTPLELSRWLPCDVAAPLGADPTTLGLSRGLSDHVAAPLGADPARCISR